MPAEFNPTFGDVGFKLDKFRGRLLIILSLKAKAIDDRKNEV